MNKREEMKMKQKARKEQEILEFLNDVNKLHVNLDNITIPSVGIKKEQDNNFIGYHISKYPNGLKYQLAMYKKEYPFDISYSKEFYNKNDIAKKHIDEFSRLEELFQ